MTSLANQLKQLAIPASDVSGRGDLQHVSLLFDKKKAATLDADTIYSLGINGLEELSTIDPIFHELFYEKLFSESSKKFERIVESKDVNEMLDREIEMFLIYLSPYLLTRPAHKCIEWLLYRFHIQAFNIDAIFTAILPYHGTNIFVRIVQLLNIAKNSCRWNWVSPIQKSGVPLPMQSIVSVCLKDSGILHFLCDLVPKCLNIFKNSRHMDRLLRPFVNFYTSVMLGCIDASNDIPNQFISQLMPFLVKGIKSDVSDYIAGTYLIVSHLCHKTTFSDEVIQNLLKVLTKSMPEKLFKENVTTVVIIVESQTTIEDLSERVVKKLTAQEFFTEVVIQLADSRQIQRFLKLLFKGLVSLAFAQSDEPDEDERFGNILEKLLEEIQTAKSLQETLLSLLFDACVQCSFNLSQQQAKIIQLCQRKFPEAFDTIVQTKFKSASSKTTKAFSKIALSSVRHQTVTTSETSVLLSLCHPESTVRLSGIKYLGEITENNMDLVNDHFIKETVIQRLTIDDSADVVNAVIQFIEKYPRSLFHDEKVACAVLAKLVIKQRLQIGWEEVGGAAVKLLFDNIILGEKVGSSKFLVMGAVIEYISSILIKKNGNKNITDALKLFLALHGKQFSAKGALVQDFPDLLKCIAGTMETDKDLVNLLNGVKEMATYCDTSTMKLTAYYIVLSSGLEASASMKIEHRNNVLFCALQEVSNSTIPAFNAKSKTIASKDIFESLSKSLNLESTEKNIQQNSASCCMHLLGQIVLLLPEVVMKQDVDFDYWFADNDLSAESIHIHAFLAVLKLLAAFENKLSDEKSIYNSLKQIMNQFITLFESPGSFILFTIPLWTTHLKYCPFQSEFLTTVSQAQTLGIVSSLMDSCLHNADCLKMLLEQIQYNRSVCSSFLLACSHKDISVRKISITCLSKIYQSAKHKNAAIENKLDFLLGSLCDNKEEISADKDSLSACLQRCLVGDKDKKKSTLGTKILDDILKLMLCNDEIPMYIKYQFVTDCLQAVDLHRVYGEVSKLISNIMHNNKDMIEESFLNAILAKTTPDCFKNQICKDAFVQAIGKATFLKESSQITAMRLITKDFFANLKEDFQEKLLHELISVAANTKDASVMNAVSKSFKAVKVDARQVLSLINAVLDSKNSAALTGVVAVKRARYKKSQTKKIEEVNVDDDSKDVLENWNKVVVLLEMIQHKKKLSSAELLISPLFDLLEALLDPKSSDESNAAIPEEDDVMEYRKQIILNSLLNICKKLKKSNKSENLLTAEKFNVELLVHSIRSSNNVQTHQHSLMLLAEAAAVCPEKVLHNVMAIFTFVGTHTIRQDNELSFQVISKTIKTIIPALLQNADKKIATEKTLLLITSVFVNAFPHIPSHRRIPVFEELLNSLGPDEHLWKTVVLLIDQFISKPSLKTENTDTASSDMETDEKSAMPVPASSISEAIENWSLICCIFDQPSQVHCFIKIIQYLIDLDKALDQNAPKTKKSAEVQVIDLRLRSLKQIRRLKLACLAFLSYMLSSKGKEQHFEFVVSDDAPDHTTKITILFRRLLEIMLLYIDGTMKILKDNEPNSQTYKFSKVLLHKSHDVIDKINTLLPTGTFLLTLQGLLQHKVLSTRKRAMDMLSDRITTSSESFHDEEKSVLMKLIKELKKISISMNPEELPKDTSVEQMQELQCTSWQAMKSVVHICAKQNPTVFADILPLTADVLTNYNDTSFSVISAVLLCLAELAISLKTHCIPFLPSIVPCILTLLKRKETLESDNVVFAALTAIHRILENLANFISPYLDDIILRITALKLIERYHESITGNTNKMISHISLRLHYIYQIISTKLPTRVLLPSMRKCRIKILDRRPKCMEYLAEISSNHVSSLAKNELPKNVAELGDFYLDCLNFRVDAMEKNIKGIELSSIEDALIASTLTMMLKLPENSFRPIYFKLYNWACLSGNDSITKLITFYRLNLALAEKLKSLFSMFSGHLISNIVELLKGEGIQDDVAVTDVYELLTNVTDVLSTILKFDTSDFLTKERFQLLLLPVVNHLEDGSKEHGEVISSYVNDHLIPCISHIAGACTDEESWKSLNYQVLLQTKHNGPAIQIAALKATEAIAEKLGEDYMLILPESIPFFAELMEDGNEKVEETCQDVIRKLEKILGEDLQKYF